jgi:hypothetical protein
MHALFELGTANCASNSFASTQTTSESFTCGCRSVGVLAYELLTGQPTFGPGSTKESVIAALAGRAQLPWEAAGAPELKKLLRLKSAVLHVRSSLGSKTSLSGQQT